MPQTRGGSHFHPRTSELFRENPHHPPLNGKRGDKQGHGNFPKIENLISTQTQNRTRIPDFRSLLSLSLLISTDQQKEASGVLKGRGDHGESFQIRLNCTSRV